MKAFFKHTPALVLAVSLAALAACTPGPRYVRPAMNLPPAYKEIRTADSASWKAAQPGDDVDRGKWWTRFEDPTLNELEDALNISNQNIATAAANVLAARAIIREARSAYFPTIGAGVSVTNQR